MIPLFLLFAPGPAPGQVATGGISGRVGDPAGFPILGAAVETRNSATGMCLSTRSGPSGEYRLEGLPPGTYAVKAQREGYLPGVIAGVVVPVGITVAGDLVMERLFTGTGQEVYGERPPVEALEPQVVTVITGRQVADLPFPERDFQSLVGLVPGARPGIIATLPGDFRSSSFAGLDGSNASYMIDGADMNDNETGAIAEELSSEVLQEFAVITQQGGAAYGRSSGGFIDAVTRGGSNEFHGTTYVYYRDQALSARDPLQVRSGFAEPDYARGQFGVTLGGPLQVDRTHFFLGYEGTRGEDGYVVVNTGGAFPGEEGAFALPFREDLLLARVDHQIRVGQLLSVRYLQQTNRLEGSMAGGKMTWEASRKDSYSRSSLAVTHAASLTQALRSTLLFHYYHQDRENIPTTGGKPILVFPDAILGTNLLGRSVGDQSKWEVRDDMRWGPLRGWGSHSIAWGADYVFQPSTSVVERLGDGGFIYGVDDPAAPALAFQIALGDSSMDQTRHLLGAYVQDDWQPMDRLTVSLGLRYEAEFGVLTERESPASTLLRGREGELRNDLNNWGPRGGASYALGRDRRWILRGGYGIYHDQIHDLPRAIANGQTGDRPRLAITLPRPAFGPDSIPDFSSRYDPSGVGTELRYLSPRLRTPFTHQGSAGLSVRLGERWVADADYAAVRGRNQLKSINLNYRLPSGQRALDARYLDIIAIESIGTTRYDALALELRRASEGGVALQVAYTLSKATGSQDSYNTRPQDNTAPVAPNEFGPALSDARHRLVANVIWALPWGTQAASVVTAESTRPYEIITGTDDNGDGFLNDRPAGTSRNAARGDPTFQWDLRLSKLVSAPGPGALELLVDVFNVTNAANFGNNYNGNMRAATFEQPLEPFTPPRQVQIGARYRW